MDFLPGAPNFAVEVRRYGVRWDYFVSWTGELGPKKNTKESLTRIYQSDAVITPDKLTASLRRR